MPSTLSPSSRPQTSTPMSSASLRASEISSSTVGCSSPWRCSQNTHTPEKSARLVLLNSAIVSIPFQSDDVLLQQLCSQLGSSVLVCAFQHAALALLRRREGLEDVGRRALQTDGVNLDQRIILQGVVVVYFYRLLVAVEDTANRHVT